MQGAAVVDTRLWQVASTPPLLASYPHTLLRTLTELPSKCTARSASRAACSVEVWGACALSQHSERLHSSCDAAWRPLVVAVSWKRSASGFGQAGRGRQHACGEAAAAAG